MKKSVRRYQCQLAIVGAGLAGVAATIFALKRGIKTAQIGKTGALAYTSGYFDLLGVHGGKAISDPWRAIEALTIEEPQHPLARMTRKDIAEAFTSFTDSVSKMGVGYTTPTDTNHLALTPAGTVKPTCSVPTTMYPGIEAMQRGDKTLIIDFAGLQGFSAKEIVVNLRASWPQLIAKRIEFPDTVAGTQHYAEVMARMLEVPDYQVQFANRLKAVLGDAQCIGMPAIMGVNQPDRVHAELQRLVGVPLFEIPTMPPAVPGIRLREMFEQVLPEQGVTLVPQQKAERIDLHESGATLHLKDSYGDVIINADATLLATGRFMSGGLKAQRSGVSEPLLSIPVTQPDSRAEWHTRDYFDKEGHQINRAGIQVDDTFRPLNNDGKLVNQNLFAAGVILAGQDWVRQRCGAGVAIASAWKAVQSIDAVLAANADS